MSELIHDIYRAALDRGRELGPDLGTGLRRIEVTREIFYDLEAQEPGTSALVKKLPEGLLLFGIPVEINPLQKVPFKVY